MNEYILFLYDCPADFADTTPEQMQGIIEEYSAWAQKLGAEGKHLERSVLDRVREETDKQLAEADQRLAAEASKLRAEIQNNVPALAKQIASKLLSREVQ